MQLYCELSQFCSTMRLTWKNERRGYELTNVARVVGDSGPGIVATISPTFAADEGPYICEARDSNGHVVDTARTFIKLTDEKTATSWREVLNNAIPSKFRIFDSRNIKAGWNHSAHWNQLPDATFQFTPMPAAKDWLTSPVIQVDAKWIEVSAEIGGCADCSISLHYFSAETPLENIRLKDFTPLGSATVGPLTHTIQFLLPFSLAWLMIAVDTKSKPMRLERLALTSMSCPNVRIGNTAFPETLVLSTNVTVNGVCAQHPSSSGLSQLICSPQGRWFAIHDQEPASACDCPPGQMNVNGRCTKDGMKCLVCDTASPDECAARSQLVTCDAGERCSTQIWRQFNGELLLRKSCAVNCFARFDNVDHCRAGQEPFCELCCEKEGCNTERPIATTTQPSTTTTTPTTTTFSTTSLPTTTEIVDTELTYLDPPPPHCIDQQTLQLSCVEVIHVVRSSSGFVEPAPVPWPTITDNDPSIRLDVNLPGLSQEPIRI
ncbi:hypothetical protein M3Y99_00885900 [Aphelenchoides fujianensis]|nr:hypothetical protein M3Y99_00885900 [Aphelenchoides fujianensis]